MAKEEAMPILVQHLLAEHRGLAALLDEAQADVLTQRYLEATAQLAQMKEQLVPHIVVEESKLLRVILAKRGREGAQQTIRILQQHRPIMNALDAARSAFSKADVALGNRHLGELRGLLREHQIAEEDIVYLTAIQAAE